MPWCPECKEEYREGVTNCAECGCELVDTLPEDDEIADYDWDSEGQMDAAAAEEEEEDEAAKVLTGSPVYTKKADEYKDLRGTGFTFVILSSLGLIYLLLCQMDIIPIHYNVIAMIVLAGMFVLFMGIGISSFINAKAIKEVIGDEEEATHDILDWLHEHAGKERLDGLHEEEETQEEYYLRISELLTEELSEEYPTAEESYLELLLEEYLSEVLDEAE